MDKGLIILELRSHGQVKLSDSSVKVIKLYNKALIIPPIKKSHSQDPYDSLQLKNVVRFEATQLSTMLSDRGI